MFKVCLYAGADWLKLICQSESGENQRVCIYYKITKTVQNKTTSYFNERGGGGTKRQRQTEKERDRDREGRERERAIWRSICAIVFYLVPLEGVKVVLFVLISIMAYYIRRSVVERRLLKIGGSLVRTPAGMAGEFSSPE